MDLYKHQKEAKEFTLNAGGSYCLFMGMGTGKTITALSIFGHYRQFDPELKLLILCPLTLVDEAWRKDNEHFGFSFAYYKEYQGEDICAINPEAMIRHYDKLTEFKMCVIDESTMLRSNKSQITKVMHSIWNRFKFRIILTANPNPNSEMELWPQVNFVKEGYLGNNFYQFRSYFFEMFRGKEIVNPSPSLIGDMLKKGFKWRLKEEKRSELLSRVKQIAYYIKTDDCLDLPPEVNVNRPVILNKDERKAYKEMFKHYITEFKGKEVVATTALTKLMKLRQITSGFGYNGDLVVKFSKSSKLKELERIIEELGHEQAIIWVNFKEEQRAVIGLLGNKATMKDHFDGFREGQFQYLVINPKSCAHGLTFTNCAYQIFYSLSYSYEEYSQARGRIRRIGQKRTCTYIHILAKDSIDYDLLEVINKKKSIDEVVYGYLKA